MERKKRDLFLIIGAIAILVITIIIIVLINIIPSNNKENFEIPKSEMEIAEALIIKNDDGLNLIGFDGQQFDLIENGILHTSNNNEILYLKNNILFQISVVKKIDSENNELIYFKTDEIMDVIENVEDYVFNDKYIALLINTENIYTEERAEEYELIKQQPMTKQHNNYNVIIIERNSSEKYFIENIPCDEIINLIGTSFVYSTEYYLNAYNFIDNINYQIYLGKEVTDIDTKNDIITVFCKFGNGNKFSTIIRTDEKLNILKALKHDAININMIQTEYKDGDNEIIFIEQDNNPIFYSLDMNETRDTKKKSNLNTTLVGVYNKNNTIYYRGYLYTGMDGKAHIIDLKSSTIYKSYDIDANFVFPIFEKDILIE